jgi:mannitol-1-/sugar-/sorbitol-6-phosphatase
VLKNVLDWKLVGRVAQLVEQRPFKAWVAGSIPAALTNFGSVNTEPLKKASHPHSLGFRVKLDAMVQISCQAMLFDLDGVLIDSTPAVARVWHRWALEHGLDPDTVVRMAHGRPSRSTIRELLPTSDIDAEDREVERREMEDIEGVILLPGAHRLLSSLPLERWTIATSCTRPLAEVRLRAAGLPIPNKMITSSDVNNGKPHPEPYQKAAAVLGFSASDCIVVEDAPAGVRAGKAAGARVIGFPTTTPPSGLERAGADWIVTNCAAITAHSGDGGLFLNLAA